MEQARNMLVDLARAAIRDQAVQADYTEVTPESVDRLIKIAKVHDLTHLVSGVLSKNKLSIGTPQQQQRFFGWHFSAIMRYERFNDALTHVCAALAEAQIPHIPLKGAVLRKYYPEPWMRTSCDIDVLVHNEDCERAMEILAQKLGYTRLPGRTRHDYALLSQNQVRLELHYTLIEDNRMALPGAVLENIWSYCVPKSGATHTLEMSNEIFMFYHIAHMAKHFLGGGCGIRMFMDLWLLQQKMPMEQVEVERLLQQGGLSAFYNRALELCRVWFEDMPHTAITQSMEKFVFTGGVFGTVESQAVVAVAKGETGVSSFLNRAFLSRESLEVVFPALKNHPNRLWLYQIKRWFRIFSKEKRERVLLNSKALGEVSQQAQEQTGELLKILELD